MIGENSGDEIGAIAAFIHDCAVPGAGSVEKITETAVLKGGAALVGNGDIRIDSGRPFNQQAAGWADDNVLFVCGIVGERTDPELSRFRNGY